MNHELAMKLSENGYIVLCYDVRGWGESSEEVDYLGPKTIGDVSAICNYLIKRTGNKELKIGALGFSHGGAISFLGAANDKRIKAVAMLSSGINFSESIYSGQTPRFLGFSFLQVMARVNGGNVPKDINDKIEDMKNYRNMEEIEEWLSDRSPHTYIEKINENNTPVFFSMNMQDSLTFPNEGLKYFEQFTSPKRIIFSTGTHAFAENHGPSKDYIWYHRRSYVK